MSGYLQRFVTHSKTQELAASGNYELAHIANNFHSLQHDVAWGDMVVYWFVLISLLSMYQDKQPRLSFSFLQCNCQLLFNRILTYSKLTER